MYEQYFGMIHTPFSKNVPPGALYESLLGPGQNDHYEPIQNDQSKSIKSGQRISWLNSLF